MNDGPSLWMGIMFIVLAVWTVFLYADISHPGSQKRAYVSLAVVVGIAFVSLVAVVMMVPA